MPNITVNTVALPADLHWRDEFNWLRSSHSEAVSLTGALIVQRRQLRQGGRPITLASAQDAALLTRAQLGQLYTLCEAGSPVTLTFADGRAFQVMFDDADNQPIEATPIQPGKVPASTDLFITVIKFKEV